MGKAAQSHPERRRRLEGVQGACGHKPGSAAVAPAPRATGARPALALGVPAGAPRKEQRPAPPRDPNLSLTLTLTPPRDRVAKAEDGILYCF